MVLVAVPLAACTSILGIDGNYVESVEGSPHGSGGAATNDDAGLASGGSTETGGTGNAGSGTGARGGSGAGAGGGENGGADPSMGGTPVVDAGPIDPNCRAGVYSGKFDGDHAPALTVVGVPFKVSGNFSFALTGSGGVLHVTKASVFKATLAWGTWSLDLVGDYDCGRHTFTGTVTGSLSAVATKLQGTMTGDLSGGEWREQEVNNANPASQCTPGAPTSPLGTGCGTWTITARP